jgi:solute carrier family 35 (GDP-fucose transporter), member C1
MDVFKKLVPVILVNAIGLIFNTLCLRSVEASFFQIARGLQLPLTIMISSMSTGSKPSKMVLAAAAFVSFGFFLGVSPSSSPLTAAPSLISILYGFLSSLFIAYHAVLIKSSLPHCNNSTIQLAWWSNAGSAVFILPFVLLSDEHLTLRDLLEDPSWNSSMFVYGSLVTGFFGFLLSIAGLLSVKVTSPITHMFSSVCLSFGSCHNSDLSHRLLALSYKPFSVFGCSKTT